MLSAIRSRFNSFQSTLNTQSKLQKLQIQQQKSTQLLVNLWKTVSLFTKDIPEVTKAETDANNFKAIKLHFVGIRDPITISQKIAEFDEQYAKALDLNLLEILSPEIDCETSEEEDDDNDDNQYKQENVSQNANQKHSEYWPVFKQVFHYCRGKDVNEEFMIELMSKTNETKNDDVLDDERIESGKIAFKTLNKLSLNSSVKDLKNKLKKEFDIPLHCQILLIYSHIILEDDHRTLKYYGLENNSFIIICISEEEEIHEKNSSAPVIVSAPVPERNNSHNQLSLAEVLQRKLIRINGGQFPQLLIPKTVKPSIIKYNNIMHELDSFSIEIMSDLDILTYEMSDNCVRMPCGHGMVPETLLEYCKIQFKEKKLIIKCPHMMKVEVKNEEKENEIEIKEIQCNKEWKYPIIRRIIAQKKNKDNENTMKLELLSAKNIIQEYYDLQKCGKCNSIIYRPKQKLKDIELKAVCPLCTKDNKRVAIHKFEQTMARYEQKLGEFDQWRIKMIYNSIPSHLTNLNPKLPKLPKLGFIHQNPIQFYHRQKTIANSTLDMNLEKNMPELPLNFFRTASDSELSEYDSEESDIHINYELQFDGYQTDYDSESESENIASNNVSIDDELESSSSVIIFDLFGNDSISDSSEDENDKEIAVEIKVKELTMKEKFLKRMQRKRDLFEEEMEDIANNYSLIYCWGCGTVWSDVSSLACSNPKCSTSYRAQIVKILAETPTKTIGSVTNVPLTRACVNCCLLIQHWEYCKHIQCRECKKNFCFVCLKPYLDSGGWQCGGSNTICPVAKRQGVECLPSANQSTVKLF